MALAVALGAAGSHVLSAKLTENSLRLFTLGVNYQIYHALGLLAIGMIFDQYPNRKTVISGWLMFVGIIGFSGGLYFYALTLSEWVRSIIPVGGLLLISSWLVLILAIFTKPTKTYD
ncbi:membrane protein [Kangiella sediminilitoris]|uniref:Membrane protein n=2 Tax=Kangiella sediminilitoris TaxID=1144748 RepID=A0A1B3B8A1_9GAMM|nr:membrane protein [Kangiella sediminilitoris]